MRYLQLDFIRGIAIILMVIFHISFDLNNFHFINIDIYHGVEWFYFRMLILTLFVLCVGISLLLSNQNSINFNKTLKRFTLLIGVSTLVSVSSYITFPNTWIYFGVLHFVAFASLFGLLFLRFEWLALILGTLIITLFNLHLINFSWLYSFLQTPLHLPKHTEDLVSFIPWFGVLLIGIFLGKKRLFLFPLPSNQFTKAIGFLGKHSLFIYLAHQPLFFGLTAGADYFLH